jgi:hypothetical protein
MKHSETPGSLLTPLELQHKKKGCDKEIVQEIVSEWLQKVLKRYTQNTRLEFQHWKGKNVIRLRLCERIEGQLPQNLFKNRQTTCSVFKSPAMTSHVMWFSKNEAKNTSKNRISTHWGPP